MDTNRTDILLACSGDSRRESIRFRTEGNETVIDYNADLSFHNLVRWLAPVMSPLIKRTGRRALDGLVAALDG